MTPRRAGFSLVLAHAVLIQFIVFAMRPALSYAALAGEARIDLRPYPALQAWIRAMRHRDGFIAMPGILDPAL